MAARKDSVPNQLADDVTTILRGISRATDATRWLTTPRAVKRGVMVGDIASGARPAIFVRIGRLEDLPLTAEVHEGRFTVIVHCVSEAKLQDDAEREASNMVADVFRAIADDETLRGNAALKLVGPLSADMDIEAMERLGMGVATVSFDITYEWAHGAP